MKRPLHWRHRTGSPIRTAGSLVTLREYVIEKGHRDDLAPRKVTYTAWTREHPDAPLVEIEWEYRLRAAKGFCEDMEAGR